MIVVPPTLDEAEGHVAKMYDTDLRDDGFVFSHTQMMAINPEAHEAFEALIRAIVPSIGVRTFELATWRPRAPSRRRTVCWPMAARRFGPTRSPRSSSCAWRGTTKRPDWTRRMSP